MCGIVAIHDRGPDGARTPPDHDLQGRRMLARIIHRGPDGLGSCQVGPTWLGHIRLSIVDLEAGAQPLGSDSGHWVVANGEIYNHRDIRAGSAYPYRTASDSEAVLDVMRDGIGGIRRLRGMFAFVVAHEDGTFVAARDALGVKPLYWAKRAGATYFASELCAFDDEQRPDVEEFPPGHAWTPEHGLVATRTEPFTTEPALADRSEATELIRSTLVDAVRLRMMADVPVGVFLSGGLDSSLVAAIMARYADPAWGPVHSFAAGTEGSSDLVAARRVAEHLGLQHHERVYTADEVLAVLPDVVARIESYEPSLVRSAVPNYLLAETTAPVVKVVLTGEGADELFAGYDYLREVPEDDLQAELTRSIEGLHNLNLQRCDRVTMAHGVEARVPFLDRDLVALAERIPIAWRLPGELGQEKALLREAFEGWLPPDLLWRVKEQFGEGSGTADVMTERVTELVGADWRSERVSGLQAPRSSEELAYQQMFDDRLHGIDPSVLGRFATA